jgi:hypothetical protein
LTTPSLSSSSSCSACPASGRGTSSTKRVSLSRHTLAAIASAVPSFCRDRRVIRPLRSLWTRRSQYCLYSWVTVRSSGIRPSAAYSAQAIASRSGTPSTSRARLRSSTRLRLSRNAAVALAAMCVAAANLVARASTSGLVRVGSSQVCGCQVGSTRSVHSRSRQVTTRSASRHPGKHILERGLSRLRVRQPPFTRRSPDHLLEVLDTLLHIVRYVTLPRLHAQRVSNPAETHDVQKPQRSRPVLSGQPLNRAVIHLSILPDQIINGTRVDTFAGSFELVDGYGRRQPVGAAIRTPGTWRLLCVAAQPLPGALASSIARAVALSDQPGHGRLSRACRSPADSLVVHHCS